MITFIYNDNSVIINYPEWEGYVSRAHLAIEAVETANGWDVWDNGIALDYRTCSIARSVLSKSEANNLDEFLLGFRGTDFYMSIGPDSNFFPFGPDRGDSNTFAVRLLDRKFEQFDQFKQFNKSWTFLMTQAPAYSLPTVTEQGDFQIGTVNGLLYPQAGLSPERIYGVRTDVSYGGDGYPVDIRRNIHETSFKQVCNEGLAAELMAFLTGVSGRGSDISIVAPNDYYLFDVAQGASGTYTTKLIQKVIECTQVDYEEFHIPLKFWMKTKA